MIKLLAALVFPIVSLAPGPAAAAVHPALADAERALSEVRAHAAALRADASAARFGPVLERLRALSPLPRPAALRPAAPLPPVAARAVAGLPPAMREPVGGLLAEVLEAGRAVAAASRDVDARALAGEAVSRFATLGAAHGETDLRARAAGFEGWARATLDGLDLAPILDAGARVAAAVDRALPALRAFGRAAGGSPAPCDLADAGAQLCVSGDGAHRYTEPRALVVDLGGDDEYAGFQGTGGCEGCPPVSVVIDLAGNDRYGQGPNGVVAGLGNLGVGIAVDVAGDDVYTGARGAGTGHVGVGVLADLAGRDHYDIQALSDDGPAQAFGHGDGIFGIGALVDAGAGDDVYSMRARGISGLAGALVTGTHGQGSATLGGALLFDGGGRDSITSDTDAGDGSASSTTQGAVGIGDAFLLTGQGDTTYRTRVTGAESYTTIFAQGQAALDSIALLEDEGGDDVYRLAASSAGNAAAVADPGCGCMRAHYEQLLAGGSIWAQGHAISFGAGVGGALVDRGGNDRYEAILSTSLTATAAPGEHARAQAEVTPKVAGGLSLTAQGMTGLDAGASGVLLDYQGNDAYEALAIATATAIATGPDAIATARGPGVLNNAQGSGTGGKLVDRGGNDTFTAIARSDASASPTPERARDGYATQQAQGGYVGGTFVAIPSGVETDRFVVEPSVGAQFGDHGEVWWKNPYSDPYQYVDANNAPGGSDRYIVLGGQGFAFMSQIKAPSTLALGAGPVRGVNAIPVSLRSGEVPLAGQRILFEIESESPCPPDGALICATPGGTSAHAPVFRTHAITDAAGFATGVFDTTDLPPGRYALVAIFSGTTARRFSVATASFTLG